MMKYRQSLIMKSNQSDTSIVKRLYSSYSKYIYSLCLVIFLIAILLYCLQTQNTLVGEFIVLLIIIFIFWDKINYYIINFFKRKLF